MWVFFESHVAEFAKELTFISRLIRALIPAFHLPKLPESCSGGRLLVLVRG